MKKIRIINKGFTLIELMITVAIIGILSAIALPMYQQYSVKTEMTEGMVLADTVRTSMAIYYSIHGAFPTDINQLNLEAGNQKGTYVATISINAGDIIATFNGPTVHGLLKNETLTLHPAIDANGLINWECSTSLKNSPGKVMYVPTTCSY